MYGLLIGEVVLLLSFFQFIVIPVFVYIRDPKKLRRFPGVSVAPFTEAWNVFHQSFRNRTLAVHEAHLKYGPAVRVGPKHVSFATLDAIRDIYGHGTPALKDSFYGAFASTHLNVSDSQEKAVHNVKRKRFAVAFAQKSIVELETIVRDHLERMTKIVDAKVGEEVDMKQMMLGVMYGVISVTMFNQDPKFLERGNTMVTAETLDGKTYETDIHKVLSGSLYMSATTGWVAKYIPWVKALTAWHHGWRDGDRLRHTTIHFVRNRLRMDTERIRAGQPPLDDFMTTLLWDKNGALCLELGELVTEAQNLFNAAGENTEIALTNIIWLLVKNPQAADKLRQEVHETFVAAQWPVDKIPTYDLVKDLPYLRACIDEGLRLRPSLAGGLPRVVPPGGMQVSGEWFDEGTTISVSTHTVHRDPAIFHDSPEQYRPERWLELDGKEMQRGFLAFSQGGRACLGRNIAYFQMVLVIATLFSRYDFKLRSPDWELGQYETFSAHTNPLPVKVVAKRA
jgi:cytochrome P450